MDALNDFLRLDIAPSDGSCKSFPFQVVYRETGLPVSVRVQGVVTDYALAICGDSGRCVPLHCVVEGNTLI